MSNLAKRFLVEDSDDYEYAILIDKITRRKDKQPYYKETGDVDGRKYVVDKKLDVKTIIVMPLYGLFVGWNELLSYTNTTSGNQEFVIVRKKTKAKDGKTDPATGAVTYTTDVAKDPVSGRWIRGMKTFFPIRHNATLLDTIRTRKVTNAKHRYRSTKGNVRWKNLWWCCPAVMGKYPRAINNTPFDTTDIYTDAESPGMFDAWITFDPSVHGNNTVNGVPADTAKRWYPDPPDGPNEETLVAASAMPVVASMSWHTLANENDGSSMNKVVTKGLFINNLTQVHIPDDAFEFIPNRTDNALLWQKHNEGPLYLSDSSTWPQIHEYVLSACYEDGVYNSVTGENSRLYKMFVLYRYENTLGIGQFDLGTVQGRIKATQFDVNDGYVFELRLITFFAENESCETKQVVMDWGADLSIIQLLQPPYFNAAANKAVLMAWVTNKSVDVHGNYILTDSVVEINLLNSNAATVVQPIVVVEKNTSTNSTVAEPDVPPYEYLLTPRNTVSEVWDIYESVVAADYDANDAITAVKHRFDIRTHTTTYTYKKETSYIQDVRVNYHEHTEVRRVTDEVVTVKLNTTEVTKYTYTEERQYDLDRDFHCNVGQGNYEYTDSETYYYPLGTEYVITGRKLRRLTTHCDFPSGVLNVVVSRSNDAFTGTQFDVLTYRSDTGQKKTYTSPSLANVVTGRYWYTMYSYCAVSYDSTRCFIPMWITDGYGNDGIYYLNLYVHMGIHPETNQPVTGFVNSETEQWLHKTGTDFGHLTFGASAPVFLEPPL